MNKQSPYILLAEDDPDDQHSFVDVFSSYGPDVRFVCVRNGKEALEYLRTSSPSDLPSLILMDYEMPVLTAGDVLEVLAAGHQYDDIPKLVWSTSRHEEYVRRCISNGVLRYFIKPNDMNELRKIVEEVMDILQVSQRMAGM